VGYYTRVLGIRANPVSIEDLHAAVLGDGLEAEFEVDSETDDAWSQLLIKPRGGDPIAVLERNLVAPGELAEEEIQEFIEEIEDARPQSAARWLTAYLPRVKVIYAFQVLGSADRGDGWSILGAVRSALWSVCGGIVQADAEGFSNEDGYHILWQFSEDVSGPWSMAVLNTDGSWSAFQMELGDPAQREAFLAGRVPEGAEPA